MQRNEYGWDNIVPPYFYRVDLLASFNEVRDALTGIGRTYPDGTVIQVAHVLKKRGVFFICHFKSLLWLDGKAEKSSIAPRHINELGFALKALIDNGMVRQVGNHPVVHDAPNVQDTNLIPGNWKRTSKYTFKTPH